MRWAATHQLCCTVDSGKVQPRVFGLLGRGCQGHEEDGGQPEGLDEWPYQEAIEVVVLSSALALEGRNVNGKDSIFSITGYLYDAVLLEVF
jgi:hypothetical protein